MLGSEPRSLQEQPLGHFSPDSRLFYAFATGWNIRKARENYPTVIQDPSHGHSSLFFPLSCNTTSCFSPFSFSLSSEIGPHYVTQDGLKFRAPEFSSVETPVYHCLLLYLCSHHSGCASPLFLLNIISHSFQLLY